MAILDRTAVLFLGIAAGSLVTYAFFSQQETATVASGAPTARIIAPPPAAVPGRPGVPVRAPAAGHDTAPPPPSGAAAPVAGPGTPLAAAPALDLGAYSCPECAGPFQKGLLDQVAAGRPVTVGVFGDSFGDGVWSGLERLLPAKQGFRVLKLSQQATGFTRYRSLNLETRAAEQIATNPVQVAVICFGANDTQGIFADGHLATLMSPRWQAVVGQRVAGLVGELRAAGAMVYWVGLPRMRKASFDGDIANMNAFYEAQMQALGVPFIDTRPMSSGADGGYAAYLPDSAGKPMLMRADDGIHMSMNGYVRITKGLAGRIRAYAEGARRTIAANATTPDIGNGA